MKKFLSNVALFVVTLICSPLVIVANFPSKFSTLAKPTSGDSAPVEADNCIWRCDSG